MPALDLRTEVRGGGSVVSDSAGFEKERREVVAGTAGRVATTTGAGAAATGFAGEASSPSESESLSKLLTSGDRNASERGGGDREGAGAEIAGAAATGGGEGEGVGTVAPAAARDGTAEEADACSDEPRDSDVGAIEGAGEATWGRDGTGATTGAGAVAAGCAARVGAGAGVVTDAFAATAAADAAGFAGEDAAALAARAAAAFTGTAAEADLAADFPRAAANGSPPSLSESSESFEPARMDCRSAER
jgi:hypothetical protein